MSDSDNILTMLPWDSNHFGIRVAETHWQHRTTVSTDDVAQWKKQHVDLLYIRSDNPLHIEPALTGQVFCTDNRVTYSRSVIKTPLPENIKEAATQSPELLFDLAILAGSHSRFFNDPKMSKEKAEELYRQWIKNELQSGGNDRVLQFSMQDIAAGCVSFAQQENDVRIGLIAVLPQWQKQGIGKKLLDAVMYHAYDAKAKTLSVVTQSANLAAVKLYTHYQMTLQHSIFTYHVWI